MPRSAPPCPPEATTLALGRQGAGDAVGGASQQKGGSSEVSARSVSLVWPLYRSFPDGADEVVLTWGGDEDLNPFWKSKSWHSCG